MSAIPVNAGADGVGSKLFLVTVAMQRVRQLQAGSRARVEAPGHKFAHVAICEAAAGLVSWEILDKVLPLGDPR